LFVVRLIETYPTPFSKDLISLNPLVSVFVEPSTKPLKTLL